MFFYRAWVTLASMQLQSLTAMQWMTAQLRCVCTYVMQRHNQMYTPMLEYASAIMAVATSPAQVVEVGEP